MFRRLNLMKNLLLLTLLLFLVSCALLPAAVAENTPPAPTVPTQTETPLPTQTPSPEPMAPSLTMELLRNGVYSSPDWGEFQLTDGIYYRPPLTSQESAEAYTTRMLDRVLFGDLNSDGVEDAVVFLATQSGGTGHFIELAAVLNMGGNPMNVSTLFLGDRVVVEEGAIQDGVITLNMRVQGPNDGMCCPSERTVWAFRLESDRLVKIP